MMHFGWAACITAGWALGEHVYYLLGVSEVIFGVSKVADYSALTEIFVVCIIAKYSMPHRGKTTGEGE